MKITLRKKDGVAILDLDGNIDINTSNFVEMVGKALEGKNKKILCNFSGVNMIDYVGISVIAVAYKNVLNHKAELKLYGVPVHVIKLFTIVGMDKVFERYETEEAALRSFTESKRIARILKRNFRRRFKRIPLKVNIEYRQKFSRKPGFHKGEILNLSGQGMFVAVEKVFSMGEILTVRLHLMPQPGVVVLDVKVVWIADRQIQPLGGPAMGLEFYKIENEAQAAIITFIETNLVEKNSS